MPAVGARPTTALHTAKAADADEEHPLAAAIVAEPAADDRHHAERERVPRHDPLQLSGIRPGVAPDRRQRDRDDADVEQGREEGRHADGERAPAPRVELDTVLRDGCHARRPGHAATLTVGDPPARRGGSRRGAGQLRDDPGHLVGAPPRQGEPTGAVAVAVDDDVVGVLVGRAALGLEPHRRRAPGADPPGRRGSRRRAVVGRPRRRAGRAAVRRPRPGWSSTRPRRPRLRRAPRRRTGPRRASPPGPTTMPRAPGFPRVTTCVRTGWTRGSAASARAATPAASTTMPRVGSAGRASLVSVPPAAVSRSRSHGR